MNKAQHITRVADQIERDFRFQATVYLIHDTALGCYFCDEYPAQSDESNYRTLGTISLKDGMGTRHTRNTIRKQISRLITQGD